MSAPALPTVLHREPGFPPMLAGMTITEYCALLPKRRGWHACKGLLLLLPRTGIVVVPFEMHACGWDCVVVRADAAGTYRPGGYSLYVPNCELETAAEVALGEVAA